MPLESFVNGNRLLKSYRTTKVDVDDIIENPLNVYPINDIDELTESIRTYGLKENLICYEPNENGKYMIASGHRRFQAIKRLLESDEIDAEIPIVVIGSNDKEVMTRIDLCLSNASRDMSEQDKTNIVGELLSIWDDLSDDERPSGQKRDWIGGFLGCSGRTAQKYINKFETNDSGDYSIIEDVSEQANVQEEHYHLPDVAKELSSIKKKIQKIRTKSSASGIDEIIVLERNGRTVSLDEMLEHLETQIINNETCVIGTMEGNEE